MMLVLAAWLAQGGVPIVPSVPAASRLSVNAPLRLAAGTPIRFVTDATIDSRAIVQGQRFSITVAEDVMVGAAVVITRGTKAVGEVDAVTHKGMFGKSGTMALRPLFIELGGQRLNLTGATSSRGKGAVGAAAVSTVLVGALGLIITGKNAVVAAGSPLTGELRDDAMVPPVR